MERPGRKFNHSPPPTAAVKTRVAVLPFTHVFMTWCLIKHRDDFIFTLYVRRNKAGRLHKSSSSFEANHEGGCRPVTTKARVQYQGSEITIDYVIQAQILP
jgi:hypothetical protein